MRIISGKLKGKKFYPPKNISARPTTDFAKEGLFNLLVNMIDFESVEALDLFSGTGSLSLELISRGCKSVTSVEKNHNHYSFIRKTAEELNLNNLFVMKMDVFKFVQHTHKQFDLIFADPPYDLKDLTQIPELILSNGLLAPEGLLIVEHSSKNDFKSHPKFLRHRNYGNVNFSFFQND